MAAGCRRILRQRPHPLEPDGRPAMTLTGDQGFDIVLASLMFGGPLIGGIAYMIAKTWRDVRLAEQATALKKDMLDRGMSADQIVAVLAAAPSQGQGQTDVVMKMIENRYPSGD